MKRLTSAVALVPAVVVLGLAGCGGDRTDSYRSQSRKAAADFKRSVTQASAKIPPSAKLRERVPGLESYRASVDTLARKLDALEPPARVAKLHDEAVRDLHALSGDLGRFEAAAKANDRAAAQPIAVRLANDQSRLRAALDGIDRKLAG